MRTENTAIVSEELESLENRSRRLIAMGQMAASLAHEIRNPLGSMELYCSLLKKDLAEMPQQRELAEQIHGSILRVNRIISNCLQFSRDFKPRSDSILSIRKFIEQTLETLEHRLTDTEVSISLNIHGDGVKNVDHHLMGQVLMNLVANGVEAVRERLARGDKFEAKVMIESIVDESGWTISVRDTGVGISEQTKERIFDPFYSTKTSGTGLGLAVVHAIVVAHEGTISIDSTMSKETKVVVNLPKAERL